MSKLTDFEAIPTAPTLQPSPQRAIEAPDPQSGIAGELRLQEDGGSVYLSKRNRDKHYFRKYEGYAISKSILDMLKAKGVWSVLIVEMGNHQTLEYNTRMFLRDKFSYEVTNEHEKQSVVPEEYAREYRSTPTVIY